MKKIAMTLFAASILSAPSSASEVRDVMGKIMVDPQQPAALDAKCDQYIGAIEARRDQLIGASGAATLENTLRPYDEVVALVSAGAGEFSLYQQVMLNAELREAGANCYAKLVSLDSEINLSRPIYDRIAAIDLASADLETRSYLEEIRGKFERAGVALDDVKRSRVQAIQDRLGELSTALARNIADDVRTIRLKPDELKGLPQDYIDAHAAGEDGMVTLNTTYPDYIPFMTYAESDDARQRFSEIYGQRAYPQNDDVLREIFTLRSELANLLGKRNFAEVALADKMVNTPEKVSQLIADTYAIARPVAEREYAQNLAVLQSIDPAATRIEPWQRTFVENKAKQQLFDYDTQEVRKYFSYNNVRDGVLELTEDMFGVEIKQWDTAVWHPDVEAYEMLQDDKVIGRFYFDNHPRPGKYTHANMIPIYPGLVSIEGEVPVGALVQNLPKGDHSTGLMEHGDVETLLHEFGHMIHVMFGDRQDWFGQASLAVEWDMVEAPSQMLENWVYDYDTLAKFAVDAQGNVIPRELVEKMNRVKSFNRGIQELRQLGLTNVSLRFHTDPVPADLGAATREWRNQYDIFEMPVTDQMQSSFSHLDGYSAYYHTYLWSRVLSADLFARFEREGLRNPQTAADYRNYVLAPGGSKPAAQLMRDFLGRDVTLEAFRAEIEKGLAD